MSDRVVVAFRSRRVTVEGARTGGHLEATKKLTDRATALGGRVVAWSATMVAFDFAHDEIEDAIELLREAGGASALDGFSAGIAQGRLEPVLDIEEGSTVALCWGPALVHAFWLARIAREGEALVDPRLEAVRSGNLLTRGTRIGRLGEERVRGLRVDVAHPWRSEVECNVRLVRTPDCVAVEGSLADMMVRAGSVGVVRAERGAGGTRFLEEIARSLAPSRVLHVRPVPVGEPLGCLRRALDNERAAARGPIVLDGEAAERLERLLAGRGLDVAQAAELVALWLADESGSERSGAVLVDDALDVDGDTLDALARGAILPIAPYRVIVRIGPRDELPDVLDGMPEGPEVRLGALARSSATQLARAFVGGALADAAAQRWGKRGGGLPLAIREALALSLESAELVPDGIGLRPRVRLGGRGKAHLPRHWILKRLERLETAHRAVVTALAVLGGEAAVFEVEELVRRVANVPVDLAGSRADLEAVGWIESGENDHVRLRSATHRDVLVEALSASELARWHRAASMVLADSARPLSASAAASHAALAGDLRRASRLALDAAKAARDAGLSETGRALEEFARTEDPTTMMRRLSGSMLPTAGALSSVGGSLTPSAAPSVMPPEGWDRAAASRSSYPPLALPTDVAPAASSVPRAPPLPGKDLLDLAGGGREDAIPLDAADLEEIEDIESLPPADVQEIEATRDSSIGPLPEEPPPPLDEPGPVATDEGTPPSPLPEIELSDSAFAPAATAAGGGEAAEEDDRSEKIAGTKPPPNHRVAEAVAALRAGRPEDVEALVRRLRSGGRSSQLADRLEAMATLSRGETTGALRLLRVAAARARSGDAADRCRAALAHGVGLAAAGRTRDALLEALDGLARAREAKDRRGEKACLRFLSQLAESAGNQEAADAWREAAGD